MLNVGNQVRKKNDPARVGVIIELIYDDQLDEALARVRFGDSTETCLVDNLEAFAEMDMWRDLERLRLTGADQFRTLLTFIRLKSPPSPIVSAFGTARVRFYPYQFKPLLKFLESPSQRLLIADDVGLGKTIEAGYILREWRARQGLQNVLIVVPARLRTKWQQELDRRFDEHFTLVNSKEIQNVLTRVTRGSELPDFFWIASYETLRNKRVVDLIKEVRPTLDLLILDEAHRVRNRNTNQFECADALKDCADAMIYLTATPVQTGMDNLYTLITLLMPDTFDSRTMFDEVVEANKPVIRAIQKITTGLLEEAAVELDSLKNSRLTASLHSDPYFLDVLKRLRKTNPSDRAAVVRLQRDVSEFSLLGHLLSRTRKKEVMENWPERDAQNPVIELTEEEKAIYVAVRSIVRLLNPQHSGWGQMMAAITAYRYTASCIPAAAEYFRERLADNELLPGTRELSHEEEREFLEDLADVDDDWAACVGLNRELRQLIQVILDRCPPPGRDSKFKALLLALQEIWEDDRKASRTPRKVVIFSYFRRTLAYLSTQLGAKSIATRVIHGGIPIDERQTVIEEFLESARVNVLISSEVGGEGIDLQKASVVVNYDLPWNPMVVEQRIGRIDRIGQMADKLVIINLVAQGTIEEKILFRLYVRIGLFRESIGDLDDIIGPMKVQKLMIEALSGSLDEEKLSKKIELTAKAVETKVADAKTLSTEVDGLLAADQAFLDEINTLVRTRRVPDMLDLKTLLLGLLNTRFSGIRYQENKGRQPDTLAIGQEARNQFGSWAQSYSTEAHRLAQKFQNLGSVPVTFDADTAMEHPRTEFIQARHPLIQFAVHLLKQDSAYQSCSFALRVNAPSLPKGLWAMGIWSLTLRATRPEARLEAVACNIETKEVILGSAADDLLVACLAGALDLDVATLKATPEQMVEAIVKIKQGYGKQRATVIKEAREIEERKWARVRTTWLQTLTVRRDAARRRLDLMQSRGAKEFALKMARATLEKREQALIKKQEELGQTTSLSWEEHDVASLLVLVGG